MITAFPSDAVATSYVEAFTGALLRTEQHRSYSCYICLPSLVIFFLLRLEKDNNKEKSARIQLESKPASYLGDIVINQCDPQICSKPSQSHPGPRVLSGIYCAQYQWLNNTDCHWQV